VGELVLHAHFIGLLRQVGEVAHVVVDVVLDLLALEEFTLSDWRLLLVLHIFTPTGGVAS
jgi:hypothetical protein